MKNIESICFKKDSREEQLPNYAPTFPYIASYVEIDRFPGKQVPWHWHKEMELFYMERGAIEYHTPGGITVFSAGTGGLVNSNVLHMTKPHGNARGTASKLHLFDAAALIGGHSASLISQKYIAPIASATQMEMLKLSPERAEASAALKLLRASFQLDAAASGYELKLQAMLSALWCELYHLAEPFLAQNDSGARASAQIKLAICFVQEHYGQKIALSDMATAAYVSERELFRTFRKSLNMTPLEYIQSYRVQKACEMLAAGEASLTQAALVNGFASSSYFGKVFRKQLGCTPRAFQKGLAGSCDNMA